MNAGTTVRVVRDVKVRGWGVIPAGTVGAIHESHTVDYKGDPMPLRYGVILPDTRPVKTDADAYARARWPRFATFLDATDLEAVS